MAKRALCIGINDYPGVENDLSGCVNDAMDWRKTLMARGFEVTLLLNADATKAGIVQAMHQLIEPAKKGDSLVITFSGHGTFVPDESGDEPDGQDEGFCPYDINDEQILLDDEVHELFSMRAKGVKIVMLSDCCHSGSIVRWAGPDPEATASPKARFLPPSAWLPKNKLPTSGSGEVVRQVPRSSKPKSLQTSGDLLISGCRDTEFSYDTQFGGRDNGAFTYYALKTLATLPAGTSYAAWFQAIRKRLPSQNYPQSPQLLGAKSSQGWAALG